MSRRLAHLLAACAACALAALAASPAAARDSGGPTVVAVPAPEPPRIDGRLDDPVWRRAPAARGFVERRPRLGARPPVRTTFRVVYDAEALYVGVDCQDDRPDLVQGRTRGRDSFAMFRDDAVSVKIDPRHDQRTTLGFAVGPAGARLDYRGIDERRFEVGFDAVWQAAAARTATGWSAELRIPWAALGIDPEAPPARLGFNVTRDHARRSATYDWALLAPPFSPIAASRYGHLVGLDALPRLARRIRGGVWRRRLALEPYVLGGFHRQIPDGGRRLETDPRFDAGLDARLRLGHRLRGALTINTDFAQVDLDDQAVNLTRFGLFFPEKRDFFLRDLDLFAFGRAAEVQPFYTRRVGLHDGEPVPILGGIKLVGRPPGPVRLGLLHVVTRPAAGLPYTSNLAARARVELAGGSNVGLLVTQRQSLEAAADSNTVIGLDAAWRGQRTPLLATAFALLSITGRDAPPPDTSAGGDEAAPWAPRPGAGFDLAWRGRLWEPRLAYAYLHPGLRADLGFLRRVGVHDASASLTARPRIERWGIERVDITGDASVVLDAGDGALLDWQAGGDASLVWDAGFSLGAAADRIHERIASSFTVGEATTIPAGDYDMTRVSVSGATPSTWAVSGSASLTWRDYYGGRLLGASGSVTARPGPLVHVDIGGRYDRVTFDDARPSFHAAVVNARLGFTFTPDLALDTFAAWNRIARLVRLQARLRLTYRPGSDLYLVYQHDLDSGDGQTRFQSLVAKATYHWP